MNDWVDNIGLKLKSHSEAMGSNSQQREAGKWNRHTEKNRDGRPCVPREMEGEAAVHDFQGRVLGGPAVSCLGI